MLVAAAGLPHDLDTILERSWFFGASQSTQMDVEQVDAQQEIALPLAQPTSILRNAQARHAHLYWNRSLLQKSAVFDWELMW